MSKSQERGERGRKQKGKKEKFDILITAKQSNIRGSEKASNHDGHAILSVNSSRPPGNSNRSVVVDLSSSPLPPPALCA